jgi:acylphosphatase
MQKLASQFGVRGWVRNVDARQVEALLVGDTAPVSALAAGAVLGPTGAHPTSVRTFHVKPPELNGFEIARETVH